LSQPDRLGDLVGPSGWTRRKFLQAIGGGVLGGAALGSFGSDRFGLVHLGFVARVFVARHSSNGQRGRDLERFGQLKAGQAGRAGRAG